jgi:hypothetical protein
MAQRPFNSIQGFSVGSDPQISVIDANGNVTATNLSVSGVSNLGPVGNVTITGGSNGQALVTDGSGVLSFQSINTTSNSAAPMPYNIPVGESYIVDENFQGLFSYPITIDGTLAVDGILIEVGLSTDSESGQIYFDVNGIPTGNIGFTFDSTTGNFAVPGNSTFSGNVSPNANITHDLGSATKRWKDLYLSNSTIYIGDSSISATDGNILLSSASGAELEVTGNANVTNIVNGNSNISVNINGNITTSVAGIANVMVVSNVGTTITGNIVTTGIKTDNYYYANGQSFDPAGNPGGNANTIQYNSNGSFDGSNSFTFDSANSVLTLGGNLLVNNVSNANTVTANYLISSLGCVTLGTGLIGVQGNAAGIFSSTITDINLGLAANVTIGSTTGNVTARGNFIANNVSTTGTVTAEFVRVSDLYSKRPPIAVTTNTVVDSFVTTEYRSAKYTIKASNDVGYQALEVLLVHDNINSIIAVYGSLSTIGTDIITLSTVINSGNVELKATGLSANTTVNLMGTYVPD